MKNQTIRKFAAVTVALSMGLAGLAGCSSSAEKTKDGAIKVLFWHSASGAAAGAMDEIVDRFNEENKGKITVEAKYQGKYADAVAKLANSVQGGNLPDAMQINDVNTTYMRDTGITIPAEELNENAENPIDFKKIIPSAKRYYTLDGKLASAPFMVSQPVLFINPDMAKQAGLDVKNPPKTRKEVVEWARTIHEKTSKAGIVFHIHPWWVEQWTAAAGVQYCSPKNGLSDKPVSSFKLTDPAQIDTWTDFQKLYQDKVALNVGTDGTNNQTAFAAQESGMMIGSSANLANITKDAKFTPIVAPFPIDSPEGGFVVGGNSVWVIGKDAAGEQEQATWKFVSFLLDAKVQEELFAQTGYLPANVDAVESARGKSDEAHTAMLEQLENNKSNDITAGCHSGALEQERKELQNQMEGMLVNGADVESTMKNVEDKSKDLIKTYLKRAAKNK